MGGPDWHLGPDGKWYPPQGAAPAATAEDPHRKWAIVVIVSGGVMVLGSLLPWAKASTGFGSIDKAGTEGDGVLTLIAGLVFAAFGWAMLTNRETPLRVITTIGAVLAVLLLVYEFVDIDRIADDVDSEFVRVSTGMGLYVTLLGAVGVGVGAVQSWLGLRRGRVLSPVGETDP